MQDNIGQVALLTFNTSRSLRAGSLHLFGYSLLWVPRTGEERKSEPARELLISEFRPSRGVKSAFHMCQII